MECCQGIKSENCNKLWFLINDFHLGPNIMYYEYIASCSECCFGWSPDTIYKMATVFKCVNRRVFQFQQKICTNMSNWFSCQSCWFNSVCCEVHKIMGDLLLYEIPVFQDSVTYQI